MLVLLMILQIILNDINPIEAIPNVQYQGQLGEGGYLYATEKTDLPNGVLWRNENRVPLNLDLFKELSLTIYGYHGSIKSIQNDFKKGSNTTGTNDNSGYNPNVGTYIKDGIKGEYRYHGYDYAGNLYTNAKFPVDMAMTKPVSSYRYLYRRWEEGANYDGSSPSNINRIATGKGGSNYSTRNINIAKDIPRQILINGGFSADGSVPNGIGGSYSDISRFEAYNYANVQTVPTHFTAGQAELRHLGGDGKKWYANITSKPETIKKEMMQVNAEFDEETVIRKLDTLKNGEDYVIEITLKATYDDKNYHNHPINKHLYYTRNDISHWIFKINDDVTGNTYTTGEIKPNGNLAEYRFTVTIPASAYESRLVNDKFDYTLLGTVTAYIYDTGDSASDTATYDGGIAKIPSEPITTTVTEDYKAIRVEIESPQKMLDTEKFKLVENTDYTNVKEVKVYIDGELLSQSDARKFLDGNWLFKLKGYDDLYNYRVEYYNDLNMKFLKQASVIVYTTKPNTQIILTGTQKENRALVATNNMGAANLNEKYFLDRATLNTTNFSINGQEIYINYQDNRKIEFLSKQSGEDITVQLDIKATVQSQYVERYDIPSDYNTGHHTYLLQLIPDYKPAIISNIWNSVLARNEDLNFMLDIVSTDGDTVSLSTYKLYYDEDNDGVAEKLIQSGNADDFKSYKPTKLGKYNIVFYAEETFGEPTYSNLITSEDIRISTLEKEFNVKNLAPQTEIYVDIPISYPEVDVVILNDENISRELNNKIVSTRIDFMNNLIRTGLNPNVQIWDLHTYVYSQSASDTRNTGGSYPPSSISYSSNGYSGTLGLTNTVNNWYTGIIGYHNETMTDTMTGGGSAWESWSKTGGYKSGSTNTPSVIGSGNRTYYKVDWWEESEEYSETTDPKTGEVIAWERFRTFGALYEATWTERVADYGDIDDYTGYYSGTIYKNVKQEFQPVYRDTSNKYIVYFADNAVNNINDYQTILNRANSKIIVIGNNTVKNDARIRKDLFIDNTKDLSAVQEEILTFISNDNPQYRGIVVLLNEAFNISFADVDLDNDVMEAKGFQIVHSQSYFDNPMGQETNTRTLFDENAYNLTSLPNKLTKSGEYVFYRRVRDIPDQRPNESEFSNDAQINIYAHRKPIASCTLDWTFNNANGIYRTTWVDTSYDPDLQYQDPEGTKGIRERKIKYRKVGTPNWIYEIPDNLTPAKYELEYIVKDNFGVWSEPFKMIFELPAIPPAQIQAKLKTELPIFSLSNVPASESLIAYDIWTRYPFDLKLQLALYNGATQVSPIEEVVYNASTGTKNRQDIYWNDIKYNIPATLRSQLYIMRIRALDVAVPTRYADINFNVTVNTPINLVPIMNEKMTAGRDFEIKATTSKYVNSTYSGSGVKVTLFDGTSHARTLILNGTSLNWNITTNQPLSIQEGTYTARFVATLPSGETETKTLQYRYVHNTPPVINDGEIFADLNMRYIYENDDVNYTLKFHDVDLTDLKINIKLYKLTNLTTPIKEYNKTVTSNGSTYEPYTLRLIDDIPIGDYKVVATVTDDYDETAILTKDFTAHDLWVSGAVTHTADWEKNRQIYNSKYPAKERDADTYWNGEELVTSANTTVINTASNVVCTKVSAEIINKDKPSDEKYLQWMNADNASKDIWSLRYWDKEWLSKDGYVINKWGADKKQELTIRFTAYFNNGWVEISDVIIYIDNRDDYWKLHRAW